MKRHYIVEVELAGGAWLQLASCDTPEHAGEVVRVLLAAAVPPAVLRVTWSSVAG